MKDKVPKDRPPDSSGEDTGVSGGKCPRCEKGIEVWDEETSGICMTCRKQVYQDDNSS